MMIMTITVIARRTMFALRERAYALTEPERSKTHNDFMVKTRQTIAIYILVASIVIINL